MKLYQSIRVWKGDYIAVIGTFTIKTQAVSHAKRTIGIGAKQGQNFIIKTITA
jgi:hypothetical protein